ncbi:MAG: T9SS type A sorting domain-containing protein [Flavobacteriales bacterium]|nr:T9SS type A sorting domain-containing protein [Flavobacteriia bacterium]NCP06287.1 T9SS type A sorting domain-containing protein [Flavobacteriales bacterium]NCP51173.1 T9SS type A sorting domain-containing protein [Flavobacteriales bacterium]NCP61127.1 T9SS type A sorting domain-containing protein [Flavobacteriales bacterium]NCP89387.1 T9SS type A sorting domain-containing protein [Flavobacteriales bacterium]
MALITFFSLSVKSQIRIVEVDPSTDNVKIHNYGSTAVNLTNYWFCSQVVYGSLGSMTVVSGSLNLAPSADVIVTSSVNLATSADLGLYNSSTFGSTTAMTDFTQWGGSFVFPNGRENVAVSKGIWTSGTFINKTPPYVYTGNGMQNGAQFWGSVLSATDFELGSNFNVYPNPSTTNLNIVFKNRITNGLLEVYDMLGKRTMSYIINSENFSNINVSNLKSGLYLVKVTFEGSTETKRFIKG